MHQSFHNQIGPLLPPHYPFWQEQKEYQCKTTTSLSHTKRWQNEEQQAVIHHYNQYVGVRYDYHVPTDPIQNCW